MNKITNKLNQSFCLEIGIIFLLWLFSIWLSSPTFNRFFDWDTAHILVSMRAFEQWGFWKLLGVSTWLQPSYEWMGVDITSQEIEINSTYLNFYLSAPSWYIIFPYVTWKLLNLIPLVHISLSSQFLECYNLFFSRLIGSIFVYYLYLEIIQVVVKNTWTSYHKKSLAFLGLLGWILSPKILFYTQNSCFGGRAYIGFLYAIFLIAIQCNFQFDILSKNQKKYLFILSFLVCATDYFGWFNIIIISLIVLINKLILPSKLSKISLNFWLDYFNNIKLMIAGIYLSGISFLIQLLYYKNGIHYLSNRFLQRSGLVELADERGHPLTNLEVFKKIVSHWIGFTPIFKTYFTKIMEEASSKNDINFTFLIFLTSLSLSLIAALYYLLLKSEDYKKIFYIYILLFFIPITYIFFLKQLSYVHKFSGFPMALPISFTLLILPILLIGKVINKRTFLIFVMIGFVIFSNRSLLLNKSLFISSEPAQTEINRDLGTLVNQNLKFNDLPITQSRPLSVSPLLEKGLLVQPLPPQGLWYTGRYIYDVPTLKKLIKESKLNLANVKKMNPVFLAYKKNKEEIDSNISFICENKWIEFETKLATNSQVIACKAPELRHLYLDK